MKSDFSRLKFLFQKYIQGKCSLSERKEFFEMVKHEDYAHLLKDLIHDEVEDAIIHHEMDENKADEIFNKIISVANADETIHILPEKNYRFRWWAAAAVLIMLAGGTYFFSKNSGLDAHEKIAAETKPLINDLAPGHSGAVLILSNGQKIILDSAQNGLLTTQGKTNIIKAGARVSYTDKTVSGSENLYNTMTTPRGRQYQLVLSDGSQVWLNAASSITFPTQFSQKERRVEITGEVYFEIKPMLTSAKEKVPFIVAIHSPSGNKREVQVLGTHFDVNSYDDESAVKTTLLEGSVKVTDNNKSVMIKPGEQAVLDNKDHDIRIQKADVDEVMAWKDGFFSFKNATIETVMRQVERWYDVDVIYNGKIPDSHYRGEVPMNVNASVMLKVLEVSGIHFEIDGKRIIVTK